MFLKILIYSVAIYFFVRFIRRFVGVYFGLAANRGVDNRFHNGRSSGPNKRIDEVEDADYTEIDDKHR
jgi:hypothetical protein